MTRRCRCCRRRKKVNEQGFCCDCITCLHCERRPAITELGLCERCDAKPFIQELYHRGRHWTPDWEMQLRRKTAEVQRRLRRRRRLLPPTSI